MEAILGIDLGTTNSAAAYMKDGRPVIIPNAEGEELTPSVVGLAGDGRRWVGRLAKAQAAANPLRTVFSVKRRMGWPAPGDPTQAAVVTSVKRQIGSEHVIAIDGHAYTPVELSAMILEKIKTDSEAYLGQSVRRAVITVPAYFNDSQRRATKEAAAAAGLEVLRLVNEPTAAALAYGLDLENAHRILVWDLGGGTFDVSVLELGEGVFEVKAVNGNTRLGGDDYDCRLAAILSENLRRQWGLDLGDDPSAQRVIRQLAEEAKITLSTHREVRVAFPQSLGLGRGCSVTVTRDAFERATADLTQEMVAPVRQALADAGLDSLDLDRVILVGGMTRMPAVRDLARKLTGLEPYAHIDPDKVVALGAAVQAGVLAGQVHNVTLFDVTSLSLGIQTQGGLFARIIHRNTPIPVARSKLFTNARDNQPSTDICVFQGERELAADNMLLGSFELCGLTPQPRGQARVEVTFDIDANGMVHVSATDLQTDASRRVRLEAAGRASAQEADRAALRNMALLESDRRRRSEIEAGIRAENLVLAARGLLSELGDWRADQAAPALAAEVESAASAVEAALADGRLERIEAARKALEALLRKLSSALSARGPAEATAGARGCAA